jgi:hypothetical protein
VWNSSQQDYILEYSSSYDDAYLACLALLTRPTLQLKSSIKMNWKGIFDFLHRDAVAQV